MLVGSTFGTVAEFRSLTFEEDRSAHNKTWSILIELLRCAGIPPERCFFTNAYPGLLCDAPPNETKGRRARDKNVVQLSPARLDRTYMKTCQGFFQEQLRSIQPRLVLFLGLFGPYVLGEDLLRLSGWGALLHGSSGKINRFHEVDSAGLSVVEGVAVPGVSHPATFALLLHPSSRKRNLHLRAALADPGTDDPEVPFLKRTYSRAL